MNEQRRNEEREALIVDGHEGALEPDQAGELSLLAGVLGDPSMWAEPGAGLEDAVVQAVGAASPAAAEPAVSSSRERKLRRSRVGLVIVAAAAAVAIVVGAFTVTRSSPSPDFTATLSGTALAPGSSASARVVRKDAGFRITLHAHGLSALPAGEYYQAWLKNAAGILVPIGTFSSSKGAVTLWSGVSPKDFPTLTVTIEAANNDQSSSGRRVLVGRADPR